MVKDMSFNEGVQELINVAETHRLTDVGELSDAYRLRYSSYLKEGAIPRNATRTINDRFDGLANSWVFGIYLEGRLASTIRLGLATAAASDIPAMTTFPDILEPILARGETILDPTRFVLDAASATKYPKLAYVTLRIAWVVADHLGVDVTLASVRTEHQAFYRRFFGHSLICSARPYPSLLKPLSLMALPSRHARERGYARYPFLRSTEAEFEMLMGVDAAWMPNSSVSRPSADQSRENYTTIL